MPTIKDLQNAVASAQAEYNAALADSTQKSIDAQNRYSEYKGCKVSIVNFGTPADRNSCQTGSANNYPGCASKSTCESRVDAYNNALNAEAVAKTNLNSKQIALDAAQKALDNFIKSDPTALDQQATRETWKTIGIVAGIVVVVVAIIWAGLKLWKKYGKK